MIVRLCRFTVLRFVTALGCGGSVLLMVTPERPAWNLPCSAPKKTSLSTEIQAGQRASQQQGSSTGRIGGTIRGHEWHCAPHGFSCGRWVHNPAVGHSLA